MPRVPEWGYAGSFTDSDEHLWVVTEAKPW